MPALDADRREAETGSVWLPVSRPRTPAAPPGLRYARNLSLSRWMPQRQARRYHLVAVK